MTEDAGLREEDSLNVDQVDDDLVGGIGALHQRTPYFGGRRCSNLFPNEDTINILS